MAGTTQRRPAQQRANATDAAAELSAAGRKIRDRSHQEQAAAATIEGLRQEADEIRKEAGYDGTLTAALLGQLQSLLDRPLDARFIHHVEANSQTQRVQNKTTQQWENKPWPPYSMTGVTNPQVQVDILNAVVGRAHWRMIKHHRDSGKLVHVYVLIGNKLGRVGVDKDDVMRFGEEADILVVEDGWGSYGRGFEAGNWYKGSQTNAEKRVLARVGPGGSVYRQSMDEELAPPPAGEGESRETAPATDATQPSSVSEEDAAAAMAQQVDAMLAEEGDDDSLPGRRRILHRLMGELQMPPAQRHRLLMSTTSGSAKVQRNTVDELIARADAALIEAQEKAAAADGDSPS